MSDPFVTIRHVADPIEAEMLVDLLEQEGIPASIPGNQHSAMLGGLAASALRVPLQVPESMADEAREILEALDEYDQVDVADPSLVPANPQTRGQGDGPYRSAALTGAVYDRKPLVAVAAALLLPCMLGAFGAGHLYARSTGRGLALLALGWGSIALSLVAGERAFLLTLPALMVIDAVGAALTVRGRLAAVARIPRD